MYSPMAFTPTTPAAYFPASPSHSKCHFSDPRTTSRRTHSLHNRYTAVQFPHRYSYKSHCTHRYGIALRAHSNGGASGGGAGGGEDGRGDGEPDGSGSEGTLTALLSEAGRSRESVAADVAAAFEDGRIGKEVVAKVLEMERWPVIGALLRVWPALRNRLLANPRFPMVMLVELAIGGSTKTITEVGSRGSRFWKEFDFYLSDICLELIGDFALVWILSPAFAMRPPPVAGTVAGALASLPSHALQRGSFTPIQRAAGFGLKGVLFGCIGFLASVVGHSATVSLAKMRQSRKEKNQANAQSGESVQLAPVWDNSLEWGKFLMFSSNARYQLLGAIEERFYNTFLGGNIVLFTLATFLTRLGNNFTGSVHWLKWARDTNLQVSD